MIRRKIKRERRRDGVVIERQVLAYYCDICGKEATYGFGINIRQGKQGCSACKEHKEEVEKLWEESKEEDIF